MEVGRISCELILYAEWDFERRRYRVDMMEVKSCEALPLHAEEICRVDREDRWLMLQWGIDHARRRWSPQKMRRVCRDVRPWEPSNR